MRRAPFVLGATIAGIGGILSYHTHTTRIALDSPVARPRPSNRNPTAARKTATGPVVGPPSAPTRTAVGRAEQYGYGVLAVRATVKGAKIVDVSVPDLQTADQYSQQLAVQVIPMLRSQVLSAQSIRINGVSGATYTSEAYYLSLQSALARLHFP